MQDPALHFQVRAQYILCKKCKVGLLKYSNSMTVACDVGPECFRSYGNFFAITTDFIIVFYQTGTCCIYVVFCGTSIKYIADFYMTENLELYIWMLILFVPFTLLLMVRNLKKLAPFSLVADIVTTITFIVVFYYIGVTLKDKFTDRAMFGHILDYPLIFGTVLFSLQSVPVVIAVENDMATPKTFRKSFGPLNMAFTGLTIGYLLLGLLGFWCYGDDTAAPITMNFPIKEILAQIVIGLYCFAIWVSYGLNALVPFGIIWDNYIIKSFEREEAGDTKKVIVELSMRITFAVVTFLLATTIPLLGLMVSLVGSLFLSCLGVIFPAFMEIAAYWEEGESKPGTFRFWKNIIVMICGLLALLSGVYSSIRAIVEAFSIKSTE